MTLLGVQLCFRRFFPKI